MQLKAILGGSSACAERWNWTAPCEDGIRLHRVHVASLQWVKERPREASRSRVSIRCVSSQRPREQARDLEALAAQVEGKHEGTGAAGRVLGAGVGAEELDERGGVEREAVGS